MVDKINEEMTTKYCIALSTKNRYAIDSTSYIDDENTTYYYALINGSFAHNEEKPKINDVELSCTVQSVKYTKKMYEPCTLEVEISAALGSTDTDTAIGTDTAITIYQQAFLKHTIDIIEDMTDPDSNASKEIRIIKDYRICAVVPVQDTSDGNNITFILKAFSPDKKLDIHKYCETFYDQTLKDIVNNTLEGKKPGLEALKLKDGDKNLFEYSGSSDLNAENDEELKQPYLVQYNESFYQFLVRTANRCGQYVYFENGILNIGTVNSSEKYTKDTLKSAKIEYHTEYDFSDDDKFSSMTGIFSSNYCNNGSSAENPSVNNEIVDDSQAYKIEDSDNYTAKDNVITPGIFAMTTLGAISQGDSLTNVATVGVEKPIELTTIRGKIDSDLKEDWDMKEGPVTQHNQTLPREKDSDGDKKGAPINDAESPLKSSWYDNIASKQQAAMKDKRIFRMEDHPNPFLLGDNFNDTHTVIEVTGEWWFKKEDTKTTDPVSDNQDGIVLHRKHKVEAITKDVTPYLGEKRIRRSTPHTAIVAQVNDPLRMGRVRVKFPWDKTGTFSPWIRVSTAAAYNGGGLLFTPMPDDEAMIDFVDGNIERPFVSGFLHTKENKPFIGTRGYNNHANLYKTLKKDDKDKDKNIPNDYGSCTITNQTGQSITLENGVNGNNFVKGFFGPLGAVAAAGVNLGVDNKQLGGCVTISDAYGVCTIKSDTGNRCITLDSPLGKIEMSAFNGISVSCPNGDIKLKGKNITLEAGNNINIKSGGNKGGIGCFTLPNAISKNIAAGALSLGDAIIAYNTGFAAMKGFLDISFIRDVLELILRPLEGSTYIKTPGYVFISTKDGGDIKDLLAQEYKEYTNKPLFDVPRCIEIFDDWGKAGTKAVKALHANKKETGKTFEAYGEQKKKGKIRKGAVGAGILSGLLDGFAQYVGADQFSDGLMAIGEGIVMSHTEVYAGLSKGGIYISDGENNIINEL